MLVRDRKLIEAFVEKVRTIPGIRGAVLFGSMARDDDDRRSDIDILLVVDDPQPNRFLQTAVGFVTELQPHREIQVTMTNLMDKDDTFLRNVFREGKILFGSFILDAGKVGLRLFLLVSYDLTRSSPVTRVRVSRRVHGHISRKKVDGKLREYRYKGLKDEPGARLVAQGAILLPADTGKEFLKELGRLKVRSTSREVYL